MNPGVCSECGNNVTSETLRNKPRLRRSIIWIRRLLILGVVVAVYQYSAWERILPTSTLIRIQDAADPRLTAAELARRFRAGELSQIEQQRLFRTVFRWRWTLQTDGILSSRMEMLANAQKALSVVADESVPAVQWNGADLPLETKPSCFGFNWISWLESDTPRLIAPARRNRGKFYLTNVEGGRWRFHLATTCFIRDQKINALITSYSDMYAVEGAVESEAVWLLLPDNLRPLIEEMKAIPTMMDGHQSDK